MEHGATTISIGTPFAIAPTTWSDGSVLSFQCYDSSTVVGTSITGSVNATNYYVEVTTVLNPMTGGQYSFEDPMERTTAFAKDDTYPDILRYSLSESTISEFSTTFAGANLSGDQLVVAMAGVEFAQLGRTFCVTVHLSETPLLEFCIARKWDYEIIDTRTSKDSGGGQARGCGDFGTIGRG